MPLFSRRRVPDVVRAVALEPGERRVEWALTASGEPVVATDRGLVPPGGQRLDWTDVEKAAWKRPELVLSRVAEVEGTGERVVLRLEDEGELPDVVRARVTGSVVWTSHARLEPRGGVRVVGRRRPGSDDLEWQLVWDRDTDPAAPGARQQAEQLLVAARRAIG